MAVKITPTGRNGSSEVFILSLCTAGSSFWAPGLLYRHWHACTHTVKRPESGWSNMVTPCYLLLASFVCLDHLETPFVVTVLETHWMDESTNSKCTSWPTDALFEYKRLLNHKMNRWCKSWIFNTKKINKCLFQNSEQLWKLSCAALVVGREQELDPALCGDQVLLFVLNIRTAFNSCGHTNVFFIQSVYFCLHTGSPGDF